MHKSPNMRTKKKMSIFARHCGCVFGKPQAKKSANETEQFLSFCSASPAEAGKRFFYGVRT